MWTVFTAGLRVTFQSSNDNILGMEQGHPEGGVVHSPPVSTESISSGHYPWRLRSLSHGDMYTTPSFISK